ncbi:MAG: hypothetical protein CL677_05460 [Bdellovibrionaceae bacterium]|nr:hypothetical protein [Pseudobdellovibrionaceae bacterium]|tara:strand:+ start:20197 stop:21027 length:831 start_codon:yes stop_codon:yes gene_type:complete
MAHSFEMYENLNRLLQVSIEVYEFCKTLNFDNLDVENKSDDSPVTQIDKSLNDFIIGKISSQWPEDNIIGEEGSLVRSETTSRCWYIDPVDGTKELISGNGEWGIHIGLAENKRAQMGSVLHFAKKRIYLAENGSGSYIFNVESGTLEKLQMFDHQGERVVVESRSHRDSFAEVLKEQMGIEKSLAHGSIGLKAALIARGEADLYVNTGCSCSLWDTCAPEIIVREAGGVFCSFAGTPLVYDAISSGDTKVGQKFFASHKRLDLSDLKQVEGSTHD